LDQSTAGAVWFAYRRGGSPVRWFYEPGSDNVERFIGARCVAVLEWAADEWRRWTSPSGGR
ncbi:MAG TPA: hypothetical protein VK781_13915, partial [Solirubrobacteraceae bacterium]|nr:hypothetical protein [Solirubrobacteraceae bacterium]